MVHGTEVYKQGQVLSVLASHIFNDRINEKIGREKRRKGEKERERKEKVKEVNTGVKEGTPPY